MNRVTIAVLPLLALAACGKADDGPKSPEQVAAEVKDAVKMSPGQWQTTVAMTKFEMPGAPPEAANAFKGMLSQATTTESCLTKEEAEKDPGEFIKKGQAGADCKFENFSAAGGKIEGKMICSRPQQGTMESTMNGTMTPETMAMVMDMKVTDPNMPGGGVNMTMKMDSKRIGECKAP